MEIITNELRVLSYNIHKGFSAGSRTFILGRIREAIRFVRADLVFLQEVLGQHEGFARRVREWPPEAQFDFMAANLWPHVAYGRNAVYTDGHHGNAILSRYPIIRLENIDVSTSRLEKRGLLHAVLDLPSLGKPLHAICLHLGLFEGDRRHQLERLASRIDEQVPHDEPLVVAGDFNDWRERASHALARSAGLVEIFERLHGRHARTFPTMFPFLRLDRIYFRGLRPLEASRLAGGHWRSLSDHAAVFARLVTDSAKTVTPV
jgi:endonuclease/exonuclease/phosphatase family metal-dependent hydrolase